MKSFNQHACKNTQARTSTTYMHPLHIPLCLSPITAVLGAAPQKCSQSQCLCWVSVQQSSTQKQRWWCVCNVKYSDGICWVWGKLRRSKVESSVGSVQYLSGVRALHVRLGAVVDSTLEHLLYTSHQEDVRVRTCYWEDSLWTEGTRQNTCITLVQRVFTPFYLRWLTCRG